MSSVEWVKMRIKPVKRVLNDLPDTPDRDNSTSTFWYENQEYRLNGEEVKSIRRDIADRWVSATTIVEILSDLGSY